MNPPRAQALMLAVIAIAGWSTSLHAQASASRPAPGLTAEPRRPVAASTAPLPWRGSPDSDSPSQQPA